jgi:hypothetical protein
MVTNDNVPCRWRSSSILQQLLQNRSLLPLMGRQEIEDAEYKNRQGAHRGREDPSSEEAGPVAELTRLPPGYPALLEELKTRIRAAQVQAALNLNQETIRLHWSIDRTSPPALRPRCGELR